MRRNHGKCITRNGRIQACWVCVTFRFGKNLAQHGLGRETLLCNETERSPALHIANFHADLSQCWKSPVQIAARFVCRYSHHDVTMIRRLYIFSQLASRVGIHVGVVTTEPFHWAGDRVNEQHGDAAIIGVNSTPRTTPRGNSVQFDEPSRMSQTITTGRTVRQHIDRAVTYEKNNNIMPYNCNYGIYCSVVHCRYTVGVHRILQWRGFTGRIF